MLFPIAKHRPLKVGSLFSGIGAFEKALHNLAVPFQLQFYCEIEAFISKSYSLIHNVPESLNLGDITKVDIKKLPDMDLMTYGFPCTDISALGSMEGFIDKEGNLTRSGLLKFALKIVEVKNPKVLIAENVHMLVSKKFKSDFDAFINELDELGYNSYWQVMNSKDYGIPHSRNRLFIVSIRKDVDNGQFQFPEKAPLTVTAKDFYDRNMEMISDDHYLTEHQIRVYLSEFRLKKKYSSLNADIINCQTTRQGHNSNPQNFVRDERGIRRLTARELLAFQGFDKEDADILLQNGITNRQIGYMSGNSITVTVLEHLFRQLYIIT